MEQQKLNQETPVRAIPIHLRDDNPYVSSPTQRRVCIKVNPTPDNEISMPRAKVDPRNVGQRNVDPRNQIQGYEAPILVYPVGEAPPRAIPNKEVPARVIQAKEIPIKVPDCKKTMKFRIQTMALAAMEKKRKNSIQSMLEAIKKSLGF